MKELNSNDTTTIKTAAKREVLLDALGNVPLKVRYITDICLYIVLTLLDSMPNLMRTFTRLVSLPLKSSMMSTLTTLMTLPQHLGRLRWASLMRNVKLSKPKEQYSYWEEVERARLLWVILFHILHDLFKLCHLTLYYDTPNKVHLQPYRVWSTEVQPETQILTALHFEIGKAVPICGESCWEQSSKWISYIWQPFAWTWQVFIWGGWRRQHTL